MKSYFEKKTAQIREAITKRDYYVDVVSGYDTVHDFLNVTFIIEYTGEDDETIDLSETVVFYEKQNVWSHFASYIPYIYISYGDIFASSKYRYQSGLWRHNHKKASRNKFYDDDPLSEIRLIFNAMPEKEKVYKNIYYRSVFKWKTYPGDVYITDFRFDEDGSLIKNMTSYIPEAKFVNLNNGFYGTFLRDMGNIDRNKPGFELKKFSNKLINGRRLSGRYLVVELHNSSALRDFIINPNVEFVTSELS
jgi:hypothetical protein